MHFVELLSIIKIHLVKILFTYFKIHRLMEQIMVSCIYILCVLCKLKKMEYYLITIYNQYTIYNCL